MKIRLPLKLRSSPNGRTQRPWFLLLAAALWHLAVAISVFLAGRFGLVPGQIDQRGLGSFASDGFMYQGEVVELCGVLRSQGVSAWAVWPTQLHVRLYSLPLCLLNGGGGFNILQIEPLNLIYYLVILVLIFKLGQIVFNHRTGLIAATMVAVWPSFLLHTTQLLRDPLLAAGFLLLMFALSLSLKQEFKWHRGVLIGIAGSAAIVLVRIVRLPMWPLLILIVVLAVVFLVVPIAYQRRFIFGNLVFAAIVIAALLITPRFQDAFHNQQVVRRPRLIVPEAVAALPVTEQIAARRQGFDLRLDSSGEPHRSEAGSDIDPGVHFNGVLDIARHVPRAAVVGFFAPFPNMWLDAGKQVGGGGRLLSGFETLIAYVIECLALIGLWHGRRQLSVWLLFLAITLGAVALGLVVANIGALYRLRYPCWALLIIFGAAGADYLLRRRTLAASADAGLAPAQPAGTFHI